MALNPKPSPFRAQKFGSQGPAKQAKQPAVRVKAWRAPEQEKASLVAWKRKPRGFGVEGLVYSYYYYYYYSYY